MRPDKLRLIARLVAGIALAALPAARLSADMGGFHDDAVSSGKDGSNGPVDNGPSLSDKVSAQFEELKPLIDAKDWPGALALLGTMEASVDATTYQGGYDTAMILDTKAKLLVQVDRFEEAIPPWEATLALCAKHPSYFYQSNVNDIVHYLAQIYTQVGSSIKTGPGPDLAERQERQRAYIEKAVVYMRRWLATNPRINQDDQLSLADMLFNLAATSTGTSVDSYLTQAAEEAHKGVLMAVHPRDELYYIEAAVAEQKGELAKAGEILELLVLHKPESKNYPPQLMQIYLNLAENTKDHSESKKYYIRAINTIEKAQSRGLMTDQKDNLNLVTIYYDLGQFGRATELLSAGLRNGGIDPIFSNWQILAYCYQQINENVQAIDAYKDAAKLFQDNGDIDFAIGQIYTSMDNPQDAYPYYVSALQKGHVSNIYATYMNVAYAAYEIQKYAEALKACDAAKNYPEAKRDSELEQLRDAIASRIKELSDSKAPATPPSA